MVRHFLAGSITLVFPYLFAVPVEFFQQTGRSAEFGIAIRQAGMTQHVSVGQQFGIEAAVIALPFVHNLAVHIQKIRCFGVLRRQKGIAFIGALFLLQQTKRTLKSFIGRRRHCTGGQKGKSQASSQDTVHTQHPFRVGECALYGAEGSIRYSVETQCPGLSCFILREPPERRGHTS